MRNGCLIWGWDLYKLPMWLALNFDLLNQPPQFDGDKTFGAILTWFFDNMNSTLATCHWPSLVDYYASHALLCLLNFTDREVNDIVSNYIPGPVIISMSLDKVDDL